jgi:hypothetical protein
MTRMRTLGDVLEFVETGTLSPSRRRDLVSAIRRIAEMAGATPSCTSVEVSVLRSMLTSIRPARHDVTKKTFSNLRSSFVAALELAGVIDSTNRGAARVDPLWRPLFDAMPSASLRHYGLATFANWCASRGLGPADVIDAHVRGVLDWLKTRTLVLSLATSPTPSRGSGTKPGRVSRAGLQPR